MAHPKDIPDKKAELRPLEEAMLEASKLLVGMAWEHSWKPAIAKLFSRKDVHNLGIATLSRLNDVDEADLAYRHIAC